MGGPEFTVRFTSNPGILKTIEVDTRQISNAAKSDYWVANMRQGQFSSRYTTTSGRVNTLLYGSKYLYTNAAPADLNIAANDLVKVNGAEYLVKSVSADNKQVVLNEPFLGASILPILTDTGVVATAVASGTGAAAFTLEDTATTPTPLRSTLPCTARTSLSSPAPPRPLPPSLSTWKTPSPGSTSPPPSSPPSTPVLTTLTTRTSTKQPPTPLPKLWIPTAVCVVPTPFTSAPRIPMPLRPQSSLPPQPPRLLPSLQLPSTPPALLRTPASSLASLVLTVSKVPLVLTSHLPTHRPSRPPSRTTSPLLVSRMPRPLSGTPRPRPPLPTLEDLLLLGSSSAAA